MLQKFRHQEYLNSKLCSYIYNVIWLTQMWIKGTNTVES